MNTFKAQLGVLHSTLLKNATFSLHLIFKIFPPLRAWNRNISQGHKVALLPLATPRPYQTIGDYSCTLAPQINKRLFIVIMPYSFAP